MSCLQAQSVKVDVSEQIIWSDPRSILVAGKEMKTLSISGEDFFSDVTGLPYVVKTYSVPADIDKNTIKVDVISESYEWPSVDEFVIGKQFITNDSLKIRYWLDSDRGKQTLNIRFVPLVKSVSEPSFKKIKKYRLVVKYSQKSKKVQFDNNVGSRYSDHSVLSSGNWVKVRAQKSGIYKVSYASLKDWGFSNPDKVNVYGNGGGMLPKKAGEGIPDDLTKNAVWHHNSALYFYIQGPTVWNYNSSSERFEHINHDYSDYCYYYLSDKDEDVNDIQPSEWQNGTSDYDVDYFTDYDFIEDEERNLLTSGRLWFGDIFSATGSLSRNYTFNFDNVINHTEGKVNVAVAARSSTLSTFSLSYNNEEISRRTVARISSSDHTGYYARLQKLSGRFYPQADGINFNLEYSGESSSIGYLDYIEVNVNRALSLEQSQLSFRNPDYIGMSDFVTYDLSGTASGTQVWDVTNPLNAKLVITNYQEAKTAFVYNASQLREFVAFNPDDNLLAVDYVEKVENQDIHGEGPVDYLIVTTNAFLDQAERLAAIHQEHNHLSTLVVTTDQIYNEFSSGQKDVSAIRNFAKMFYDRAETDSEKPKFMLLFGDGSYDNRSVSNNNNQIVTYESEESLHQSYSYVSDDFFCCLDDGEGDDLRNHKMDIGIGRFPVNTYEEAVNAVDKSENYLLNQDNSVWKTNLTFVADDGNAGEDIGNIHMSDADEINTSVESRHPEFNIKKIYFDAYTRETTASGFRYPQVEQDIFSALQAGTLILNYTGHGGTGGLGHESVVDKNSINSWTNKNKLSVFMTATCEFSRFDLQNETSAGEMAFLNPLGGGIALFTTTRIVYSSQNKKLNTSFYNNVFEKDENGKNLSFGEIFRLTKNETDASVNKLNFTLLGDPALHLIYPDLDVIPSWVNNHQVEEISDTLRALSTNNLEGFIAEKIFYNENEGDTINIDDFNGEIYVTVYDKPEDVETKGNIGNAPFKFKAYSSKIFYGRSSVEDGNFNTEFVVPKDIRLNYGTSKISFYANNGDEEAFGALNDIVIGGINSSAETDIVGPDVDVYLNARTFRSGDETTPAPLLLIDLFDKSGINTTGAGIGHDIILILDGDVVNQISLNSYYAGALNDYQTGYVEYQMGRLESGKHTLKIKAWDVYNNSTEKEIEFHVNENGAVKISDLKFYENPIKSGDSGYFSFTQDEPNVALAITINVYSLDGKIVGSKRTSSVSLGETVPPIEWKAVGSDGKSLDSGLYIYQISVSSETGRKGKVSGKILIVP